MPTFGTEVKGKGGNNRFSSVRTSRLKGVEG